MADNIPMPNPAARNTRMEIDQVARRLFDNPAADDSFLEAIFGDGLANGEWENVVGPVPPCFVCPLRSALRFHSLSASCLLMAGLCDGSLGATSPELVLASGSKVDSLPSSVGPGDCLVMENRCQRAVRSDRQVTAEDGPRVTANVRARGLVVAVATSGVRRWPGARINDDKYQELRRKYVSSSLSSSRSWRRRGIPSQGQNLSVLPLVMGCGDKRTGTEPTQISRFLRTPMRSRVGQ